MYYAISGDDSFLLVKIDTSNESRFTYDILMEVKQPKCSFLCVVDNYIFAITEGEHLSALALYRIDCQNAKAEKIDECIIHGDSLCHLSYSKKHAVLFGSCYGNGVIFSMPFNPQNPVLSGITYHHQNQSAEFSGCETRAHCGVLSLNEDTLFCANIALDRIYSYSVYDGKIEEKGFLQLPKDIGPNLGPRHILPLSDNSYYVITEYSNEILLINNNALSARYSTTSESFKGESFGASISIQRLDDNNMRLYASNRGENSIAVFDICPDGTLKNKQNFPCGNWPRHIEIQKSLLAVCASKDNAVEFYNLEDGISNCKKALSIDLKGAAFCTYIKTIV